MTIDISQTAIVLIDVQGNLAQAMHDKDTLFKNLEVLMKAATLLDIPVIWMEQVPHALGPTVPEVAAQLYGNTPIAKTSFSCYQNADFRAALEAANRETLILTGIETHICVYQSAVDLITRGYAVQVAMDAVSSRIPENKALGLARIRQAGACITGTEMLLFELLKDATHPQFKQIVSLIK
ncbi:MAG: hydrolase [Deltaproteobacteria bacterium]|nr:MAG: hydrolase [Deltaproteobacteria bacterium]